MKTSTATKAVAVTSFLALILVSALAAQKQTALWTEGVKSSNSDDVTLVANVNNELSKSVSSKITNSIKVDSKAQVVTLTGAVNCERTKEYAAEIAGRVEGVKDVVNNIVVTPARMTCPLGYRTCCCPETGCECFQGPCPICS